MGAPLTDRERFTSRAGTNIDVIAYDFADATYAQRDQGGFSSVEVRVDAFDGLVNLRAVDSFGDGVDYIEVQGSLTESSVTMLRNTNASPRRIAALSINISEVNNPGGEFFDVTFWVAPPKDDSSGSGSGSGSTGGGGLESVQTFGTVTAADITGFQSGMVQSLTRSPSGQLLGQQSAVQQLFVARAANILQGSGSPYSLGSGTDTGSGSGSGSQLPGEEQDYIRHNYTWANDTLGINTVYVGSTTNTDGTGYRLNWTWQVQWDARGSWIAVVEENGEFRKAFNLEGLFQDQIFEFQTFTATPRWYVTSRTEGTGAPLADSTNTTYWTYEKGQRQ